MTVDLEMLKRWLSGWCLARGLPLPQESGGGLVVEVGAPDQLRRHVFVDAGADLQACALQIRQPHVFLKAAVDAATLRAALPAQWHIDQSRFFMRAESPFGGAPALPPGYAFRKAREHAAHVVIVEDTHGERAAIGRVVLHEGCAIFDRIETHESHRRKGLGTAVMYALDDMAREAEATERLLVATAQGQALYTSIGWQTLSPYSTAFLPDEQMLTIQQLTRAPQWRFT